jgi:hypothetical protein
VRCVRGLKRLALAWQLARPAAAAAAAAAATARRRPPASAGARMRALALALVLVLVPVLLLLLFVALGRARAGLAPGGQGAQEEPGPDEEAAAEGPRARYLFEPEACLHALSDASGPLTCGLKPARDRSAPVESAAPPGGLCGELPLRNGTCFTHARGRFVYSEENEHSAGEGDGGLRGGAWALPPCEPPFHGAIVSVGQDGDLSSPDCSFALSLAPRALMRRFGGMRVLFVGESHLRNMLYGVQAAVRRLRNVFERVTGQEEKERGLLYRYRVSGDSDDFSIAVGPTEIEAMLEEAERGPSESLEFFLAWSPMYRSQSQELGGLLRRIQPTVMVHSVIPAYEPRPAMPEYWKSAVMQALRSFPPRYYLWMHWPWGLTRETMAAKESDAARFLADYVRPVTPRAAMLSYAYLDRLVRGNKLGGAALVALTWHSACQVWDASHEQGASDKTFVGGVGGADECRDPYDKAYARVLINLLTIGASV